MWLLLNVVYVYRLLIYMWLFFKYFYILLHFISGVVLTAKTFR